MKSIVLKYGIISGVILVIFTAVAIPLCFSGVIPFERSEIIGYSAMVLSFLMVFFGIRSYRQRIGGTITFANAFKVGILITLITCAFYVVSWEIVYFGFIPDFEETYAAFTVKKMRESGASAAEIAATEAKMEDFKRLYKNPLFNVGITFLEVFPVGLIVTVVSAAILRKRRPAEPAAATAIA